MLQRLLLLVSLLLVPVAGWAGTHLDTQGGVTSGFSTATASFTSVAAGDQFACGAGWANGAATITSISNGTDTFTAPAGVTDGTNAGGRYLLSSTPSGSVTITLTLSSGTDGFLICDRFSGAGAYTTGDGVDVDNGPGTGTDAIGTDAVSVTGAYLFAWTQQQCCTSGVTLTPGTGWTSGGSETSSSVVQGRSEYIASGTGSLAGTFTTSNGTLNYQTGVMAFNAAGGGTTSSRLPLVGVGR